MSMRSRLSAAVCEAADMIPVLADIVAGYLTELHLQFQAPADSQLFAIATDVLQRLSKGDVVWTAIARRITILPP